MDHYERIVADVEKDDKPLPRGAVEPLQVLIDLELEWVAVRRLYVADGDFLLQVLAVDDLLPARGVEIVPPLVDHHTSYFFVDFWARIAD